MISLLRFWSMHNNDDERKYSKAKNKKMLNRVYWTLAAILVLSTSAIMVQTEQQTHFDSYRMSRPMEVSIMGSRESAPMTEIIAEEEEAFTPKRAARLKSSSTMGKDVLMALDESMKNIPDHSDNVERMLVHRGHLSLQAWKGELQSMANRVDALVTKENRGYVESRSSSNIGYDESRRLKMDMEFRIQSQFFRETVLAIQELVGQNMVVSVSVNSQDVTDSYIDASARADTLDASRNALRTLLEKATMYEKSWTFNEN